MDAHRKIQSLTALVVAVGIAAIMALLARSFIRDMPKPYCGEDSFIHELHDGQEILQLDKNYEPIPCKTTL